MNDIDRMLIEHECCKLMLLYCRHTDHLAPTEFANLFTEDAHYNPAAHPEMNGRDEILTWISDYPRDRLARHVSSNQVVDVIDSDNAKGRSYAVVYRQEQPVAGTPSEKVVPRAIVEYYDTFRRTADGWLIASREYQYTFLKENN